ncbi:hypothetical protein [Saccharothrix stipae]
MSDDDKVPDELRLIPVTNSADGTFTGIQAGVIHGGVQFGVDRASKLVVLRATQAEMDDVRRYFEPPDGYTAARRALDARGVVVLTGPGSGRSYTARRLLVDVGAVDVVEANRERALGTFDNLVADTGYVWDVRESRGPFDRAEFERVTRLVKSVGCHLVIVLDSVAQAPLEATDHVVQLTAPRAYDVARAELRRRCPAGLDGPLRVLTTDLELEEKASPEKAVRAAELAIRVHEGLDPHEALAKLREHVEQAVERHLAERTDLEFALSFAVALLENQPYDEVMALALSLDEALRAAGHEGGEPLRHKAFALSKKDLLAAVTASTTVRDHPDYPGLREETIHFTRQGWAGAVLRRLWREYPLAHDALWRWMSDRDMIARFTDAVQRAVITIVTEIPAHEPLQLVDDLARRGAVAHQHLAASVVARLDERYRDLVSSTVDAWTDGTAYEQATAVWFSLNLSDARPLRESLRRLELIARSTKWTPRNAVVAAVLGLIQDQGHRTQVLDAVVSWTSNRRLAQVALPLAMWITGYFPYPLATDLATSHPDQMKVLANRVLTDPESRHAALECLTTLSDEAHLKETSAKRLVHLARLLATTFSWMGRRKAVLELSVTSPEARNTLRRAFRVAAQVQEKMAAPV